MKDSKNLVIGMLCAVICILSVAYAAFSTTLNINGTSTVTSRWGVSIIDAYCHAYYDGGLMEHTREDAVCTESSTVACAGVTVDSAYLTATITMEFVEPEDAAECWITYENTGTLEAKLTHTLTGTDGSSTLGTRAIEFDITGVDQPTILTASGDDVNHTIYVMGRYNDVKDAQGNSVDLTAADKTAEVHIVTVATQNME